MRNYELALVLSGDVTSAKKKSVTEKLEKLLKVFKGTLGKADDWGKTDLAYEINGNSSGVFMFFPLELEPEGAKQLAGKLRLEEDVLRFLLVKSGKSKKEEKRNGKKSK